MDNVQEISGSTEQEVWSQVEAGLTAETLSYEAIIKQNGKEVSIYMDIEPGGGFENSSEITQFETPLPNNGGFKFSMHDKGLLDSIAKFFGIRDPEVGNVNFDERLIIKTNDKKRVRDIFKIPALREVFASLGNFDCSIHLRDVAGGEKQPVLALNINAGINKPAALRKIYHAFCLLTERMEQEEMVSQ